MDEDERVEGSAARLFVGAWTLDDFLRQLRIVRRLGPLTQILRSIPGYRAILEQGDVRGERLTSVEAIISSMTAQERRHPRLLRGRAGASRRRRVADGSGTRAPDVTALVKQFEGMTRAIARSWPAWPAWPESPLDGVPE